MSDFYDIDYRRVTLREYLWGTWNPLILLIALVFKVVRVKLFPCSTDDPPVPELRGFEVDAAAIPPEVRERLGPLEQELERLGFSSPRFHSIHDPLHETQYYWITLRHGSGTSWARIHHRVWSHVRPPRVSLFPMFFSAFTDGRFLASSAGRPDLSSPRCVRVQYHEGSSASALWAAHQQALDRERASSSHVAADDEQMLSLNQRLHEAICDHHLRRGVFVPLGAEGRARIAAAAEAPAGPHAAVLAEIERLQQASMGFGATVLLLVVSALVFVGVGARSWSWSLVLALVPILLFHELGHYVTMRRFGYRNLRMLFIPFLGAAVSGQHYNVPGWKRAVVSLMGPLPGILVGGGLGLTGWALAEPMLVNGAMLTVILNAFNLLPILPLDGGWVMHAVLFSRHPLLEVGFRLLAIAALIAGGTFGGDPILALLSIPWLMSLPSSWRVARIVAKLRTDPGIVTNSTTGDSIPEATARTIIGELQEALPGRQTTRTLAQHSLAVFRTLNAHPPGWVASLALVTANFAGLAGGLAIVALLVVHAGGADLLAKRPYAPSTPSSIACGSLACDGIERTVVTVESAGAISGPAQTLIATFANDASANAAFNDVGARLDVDESAVRFGHSLLVGLAAPGERGRAEWVRRFEATGASVVVDEPDHEATLSISCQAANTAAAAAITAELLVYLDLPTPLRVAPPWLPQTEIEPATVSARQRAWATAARIEMEFTRRQSEPVLNAIYEALEQADASDDQEVNRLLADSHSRIGEIRAELLADLRADGNQDLDRAYLDLYASLPAGAHREYEDETGDARTAGDHHAWEPLADHLGRLPMADGGLVAGAERFSQSMGFASHDGPLLHLYYWTFLDPSRGAPALVEWLCRRGCSAVEYEVFSW